MSCVIVFVSRHKGNTKKVAEEIAKALGCEAKELTEVTPDEAMKHDVIGVGSGIYAFSMDKRLKRLFENVKDAGGKKVFLFSTSAGPDGKKYHKSLKKFLQKRNFVIIGEFNCLGEYSFWFFGRRTINPGRPNEEDIERAREFAREIQKGCTLS